MSNRIANRSVIIMTKRIVPMKIEQNENTAAQIAPQNIHQLEVPECRICIESGNLIRPCKCSGSAAGVHFQCLKLWILKKSEDRDGKIRHLDDVKCEMCGYKFRYHSRTENIYNCDELAQSDCCKPEIVLQLFFTILFLSGAIICGTFLLLTYYNGGLYTSSKSSVTITVLIVGVPSCLIVGTALLFTFIKNYLIRKERSILSIDEYEVPITKEKTQKSFKYRSATRTLTF